MNFFFFIKVKTDSLGRMDTEDLKRAIKDARSKGFVPFFVNATAGTTILGAFDPIEKIAAVCREEKLWLHVDVRIRIEFQQKTFCTGSLTMFVCCRRLLWAVRCCCQANTATD